MGKRDPELSERVNVTGTRRLLEASQRGGVGRFVYISSISVYRGTESETRVFSEDVEPQLHPRLNHYSRTKLLGEHLVTEYCGALSDSSAERPLSFTTIRPTNVYGPGCRPWGTNVERLTSRYHICFGRVTFNFIHIDDLVRGIIALASHPDAANDAFNLAAEPVELWAFHRYIARRIGAWTVRVPAPIDGLIRHAIDLVAKIRGEVRSTGYTQRFIYPHDKTTRVCGYQPQHLIHAERD
jgi:nucleoside-diphosphate-sugar epimerase